MKKSDLLTDSQQSAIDRLYEHDHTLLYAKMGAGKTVIALTAMSDLLRDGVCSRILVVAPLSVCKAVWASEHKSWSHLQHLNVVCAVGSISERIAALESDADIVVINFDTLKWLFKELGRDHGFDGLLIDELSKLKSSGSQVFKALRYKIDTFKWRVGMTGTPVSENWEGLYSQCMCVDGGAALGTRKDAFLRKYFYPTDYHEYNWELKDGADAAIIERVHAMLHSVSDYRHELPELIEYIDEVEMSLTARNAYDLMRVHSVLSVSGFYTVIAENAAVLVGKLQQLANGFLYVEEGKAIGFHSAKYDYVNAVCRWHNGQNRPLIVVYTFKNDCDVIREGLLGEVDHVVLETRKNLEQTVERWNAGKIPVLLMHPKSAAHGLNLAKGGCDMLFVGPVWSRDLMTQTVARLWRRGQDKPVTVTTVITERTVDRLIIDRVEEKGSYEELLESHL